MPKSRRPTQKELNGVSVDFCLTELCLSIFLCVIGFYFWFLILCFCGGVSFLFYLFFRERKKGCEIGEVGRIWGELGKRKSVIRIPFWDLIWDPSLGNDDTHNQGGSFHLH